MKESMLFAFEGINLVPTILLGLVVFYWVMTILGFISNDLLEFDFGIDADIDVDVDLDIDMDIDADVDADMDSSVNGGSFFIKILKFSNIGSMPFMVYMTFFSLVLWVMSMLTYYFRLEDGSIVYLALFIVNLVGTFLITKGLTQPILPFFKGLERNEKFAVIGRELEVTIAVHKGRIGQGMIVREKKGDVLLNITADVDIDKGSKCRVVAKVEDRNLYRVEKLDS